MKWKGLVKMKNILNAIEKNRTFENLPAPPKALGLQRKNDNSIMLLIMIATIAMTYVVLGPVVGFIIGIILVVSLITGLFFYYFLALLFTFMLLKIVGFF